MHAPRKSYRPWVLVATSLLAGYGCRGILGAEPAELVSDSGAGGGVGGAGGSAGSAGATGTDGSPGDSDASVVMPLGCKWTVKGLPNLVVEDLSTQTAKDDRSLNNTLYIEHGEGEKAHIVVTHPGPENLHIYTVNHDSLVVHRSLTSNPGWPTGMVRHKANAAGIVVQSYVCCGPDGGTSEPMLGLIELSDNDFSQPDAGLPAVPVTQLGTFGQIDQMREFRALPDPDHNGFYFVATYRVQGGSAQELYRASYGHFMGSPVPVTEVARAANEDVVRPGALVHVDTNALVYLGGNMDATALALYTIPDGAPQSFTQTNMSVAPAFMMDIGLSSNGMLDVGLAEIGASAKLYTGQVPVAKAGSFALSDLNSFDYGGLSGFPGGDAFWRQDALIFVAPRFNIETELGILWIDVTGQVRIKATLANALSGGTILRAAMVPKSAPGVMGARLHVAWIEHATPDAGLPYDVLRYGMLECVPM